MNIIPGVPQRKVGSGEGGSKYLSESGGEGTKKRQKCTYTFVKHDYSRNNNSNSRRYSFLL